MSRMNVPVTALTLVAASVAGWVAGSARADGNCTVSVVQVDLQANTEATGEGTNHAESATAVLHVDAHVSSSVYDESGFLKFVYGDASSYAHADKSRTNTVTVSNCSRRLIGTYTWTAWGSCFASAEDGHAEASIHVMGTDDAGHFAGIDAAAAVTSTGQMATDGPRGVFQIYAQQYSVAAATQCTQGTSLFSFLGEATAGAEKERSFSGVGEGELLWSTLYFTLEIHDC